MDRWRTMAHARAWREVRSFAELCELGARFVTGELRSFPGWGAERLDEESLSIVPSLLACNRGGFLTVASQPGFAPRREQSLGHGVRAQRAFVAGFASAGAVGALRAIASEGISICEEWPGGSAGPGVAAALLDGEAAVFAGGPARREELALFAPAISRSARAELASLPFVWAIALAWEEQDALWRELARAFRPLASTTNP